MVRVLVRGAGMCAVLLVADLAAIPHTAGTPRTIDPEKGAQRQKNASYARPRGANYCAGLPLVAVSGAAFSTDLPSAGPDALRHVDVSGVCRDNLFWHLQNRRAVAWA